MKIAVIGAGNVGSTLGIRWAEAGHEVMFGLREGSDKALDLIRRSGSRAAPRTIKEAVSFANIVLLAVPYKNLQDAIKEAGDLNGKTIIDCTNPVSPDFSGLSCPGGSAAEEIAKWTGSGKVVKCFNTVGFNVMENPDFAGTPASMLYCGDDAGAKDIAARLAADIGFSPLDAGPLTQARWLESLAWLWISMAIKYGHGREMAFTLLKRG